MSLSFCGFARGASAWRLPLWLPICAALLAISVILQATSLRPSWATAHGGLRALRAAQGDAAGCVSLCAGAAARGQPDSDAGISGGSSVFDTLAEVRGAPVPSRRAIATLVSGDMHVAGVLTLAYSLRKHGNVLPLLLFHTDTDAFSQASRDVCRRAGWELRVLEGIEPFKPMPERYHDACALTQHHNASRPAPWQL